MSDILNVEEYIKFVIGLVILVDPVGNIPVFLSLTRGELEKHRTTVILFSMTGFIFIMIFFLLVGDALFAYFGLSVAAFQVAGGLLMLKIAYDMFSDRGEVSESNLSGKESAIRESAIRESAIKIALVPLAIPLFAGPGAITITVIYSNIHQAPDHTLLIGLVILSVALLTSLVLKFASKIEQLIGSTGMHVMNQVMAILVAVIGVEFVLDGIAGHFGIEIPGIHL